MYNPMQICLLLEALNQEQSLVQSRVQSQQMELPQSQVQNLELSQEQSPEWNQEQSQELNHVSNMTSKPGDFSKWLFTISPHYADIKEGVNNITAKASCDSL
jgi:hypothetical protein